jgi:hypothetical protein
MGIKNWTVIGKGISKGASGAGGYMRYLQNIEHKNHKGKTEAILPIFGDAEKCLTLAVTEGTKKECKNGMQGKGGRPIDTLMQSFVFSLPDTMPRPTPKQWKDVARDLIIGMADFLEVEPEELARRSFGNVHDEKCPHLNIVIGRIWDGEIKNKLKQRSVLGQFKREFNKAILTHMGVSHLDYVPVNENMGTMKKWQYEQMKAKEEQKKLALGHSNSKKLLTRLTLQLGKWIEGKKPIKRVENTLKQAINNIEIPEEALLFFDEAIKKAEKQKGETSGLTIKNKCSQCKTRTVTIENAICSKCSSGSGKIKIA